MTMRNRFAALIAIATLLPALVFAQGAIFTLPDPGLTPDSPLYFLKEWREGIQLFFTFGAEAKAKQYLHLAEVRLAEYQKMVEKGKQEIAEKTIVKYQDQLDRAVQKAQKLKGKGAKDVIQKVEEATSKHLQVLQDNLAKVPEAAKKGLERAIEASQKGIEKIKGVVEKNKEAPSETPSDASDSPASSTASWKTYRNEQYGFEVRYPTTWVLDNPSGTGEDIHLSNSIIEERQKSDQVVIEIQAFHTKPAGDFESYVRNYVSAPKIEEPGPGGLVTEVKLGNNTTFKVEHSGGFGFAGPGYFIEKDSTHYIYILVLYGDAESKTVDQILSTFKFISPGSSSNTCAGRFTFPAGGENFYVGGDQPIEWQMPDGNEYYHADIDLVRKDETKIGRVINWNWVKYVGVTSTDWDVKTIYKQELSGYEVDSRMYLPSGQYKLIFHYKYSDAGSGKLGCNVEGTFESNYFNIIAQNLPDVSTWKTCRNEKSGYEIKYPPDWKVWRTGPPEARIVTCEEGLQNILVSSGTSYPGGQEIGIDVQDQKRLENTIYTGVKSVNEYLGRNPRLGPVIKEAVLNGERLVWLNTTWALSYHSGSIFEFRGSDEKTLDQILSTFKFIEPK